MVIPLAASPRLRAGVAAVGAVFLLVIGALAWAAIVYAGTLGLVVGALSFVVFAGAMVTVVRIALDARPTITVADDAIVFDRPAMLRRPLRVPVSDVLCAVVGADVRATRPPPGPPSAPPFVGLDFDVPNVGIVFRTPRPVPEARWWPHALASDPFLPRPARPLRRGVYARAGDERLAAAALGRVLPVRAPTKAELRALAFDDDVRRRTRRRAARGLSAFVAVVVVLMVTWDYRWVYLLVAMFGFCRSYLRRPPPESGAAPPRPPSLR